MAAPLIPTRIRPQSIASRASARYIFAIFDSLSVALSLPCFEVSDVLSEACTFHRTPVPWPALSKPHRHVTQCQRLLRRNIFVCNNHAAWSDAEFRMSLPSRDARQSQISGW